MPPDLTLRLPVPSGHDLVATLRLLRLGPHDPTWALGPGEAVHALWGPEGPVTVALRAEGAHVSARCWGPGTGWVAPRVEPWLGLHDDPASFRPRHPRLAALATRLTGAHQPIHPDLLAILAVVVLQQRVAWRDAARAWAMLCSRLGGPAPGPWALRTPPDPARLAALSYADLHPLGVERRRAGLLIGLYRRRDSVRALPRAEAAERLRAVPGVGPWTTAMVAGLALGDADAVPVGDLHLPRLVGRALGDGNRVDDEGMLELLAPYRPHRWRIVRALLLDAAA